MVIETDKKQKKEFNAEEFRVKFRAFFSVLAFLVGMAFLSISVFSKTAADSEFIGPIVGFISGTLLTLIMTYYFGSSDGQVNLPPQPLPDLPDRQDQIKDIGTGTIFTEETSGLSKESDDK